MNFFLLKPVAKNGPKKTAKGGFNKRARRHSPLRLALPNWTQNKKKDDKTAVKISLGGKGLTANQRIRFLIKYIG